MTKSPPKTTTAPTGHIAPFGLRMLPELRILIEEAARISGRSMNAEIAARLQESFNPTPGKPLELFDLQRFKIEIVEDFVRTIRQLEAIEKSEATPEVLSNTVEKIPKAESLRSPQSKSVKQSKTRSNLK